MADQKGLLQRIEELEERLALIEQTVLGREMGSRKVFEVPSEDDEEDPDEDDEPAAEKVVVAIEHKTSGKRMYWQNIQHADMGKWVKDKRAATRHMPTVDLACWVGNKRPVGYGKPFILPVVE